MYKVNASVKVFSFSCYAVAFFLQSLASNDSELIASDEAFFSPIRPADFRPLVVFVKPLLYGLVSGVRCFLVTNCYTSAGRS